MLTDLGNAIYTTLKMYPDILDYWDYMTGHILIPQEVYESDESLRQSVFNLLGNIELLVEYNHIWGMTRKLIVGEDGDLIKGVVIFTLKDIC